MSAEHTALLLELALDFAISARVNDTETRLIQAVHKVIACDALALLHFHKGWLTPVAIQGLATDTMGRRFKLSEHPRFAVLCNMSQPYAFPDDCNLPDPYDGLLLARSGDLPVHSCMGIPLHDEQGNLLGLITVDSLEVNAFTHIPEQTLTAIANLGSQAICTARALQALQNQAEQAQLLAQELNDEAWQSGANEIIGKSQSMTKLKQDIALVASSDFNVLITGETGVGKELVARNLHQSSPRQARPLVHVNCAALTESLAEAELFGHAKGAFTGADQARSGKFALADQGTLFLDEVGELPLSVQSKLLRAIQSGEIQRVGDDQVSFVDVRVIAATNRDLANEVAQGQFRADLYHRLTVYPIQVPALRNRNNDVLLIAGYFLEKTRRKLGLRQLKLADDTINLLLSYSWPGNVRELEHLISRASLHAKAHSQQQGIVVIAAKYLDIPQSSPNQPTTTGTSHRNIQPNLANTANNLNNNATQIATGSLKTMTEAFQRSQIISALQANNGNWTQAAIALQQDRANLVRLAKRLGITITKRIHSQ